MGQCESEGKEEAMVVLSIPLENIQSDYPIQAALFSYPQRFFLLVNPLPSPSAAEEMEVEFTADGEEVRLGMPVWSYSGQPLRRQCRALEIRAVFLDQLNISKVTYGVEQEGVSASLFIRNFHSLDMDYLNIAQEISTYQRIAALNSPYLHTLYRHFCILPEPQVVDFYSHVAVLEPITCSLSSIIRQRRKEKRHWTLPEFCQLFSHLVAGLLALHSAGLSHNDIRPSNVYYSEQKKCFLLGSFSNVMPVGQQQKGRNFREGNHYRDLYSTRRISRLSTLQAASIDLAMSDVYSLGMTLLSTFYLCEPIDRKKCAPYNRSLKQTYPYLAIIKDMTCRIEQRKTIWEIHAMVQTMGEKVVMEGVAVKPAVPQVNAKKEALIAEAYRCLGLVGRWKDKLKQIFSLQQAIDCCIENARRFEQLAISSRLEGRPEKSMQEHSQAAEIYCSLAHRHFQERAYLPALDCFRKGLANCERLQQPEAHENYLSLLVGFVECSVTSGHGLIPAQQLAGVQVAVERVRSSDPKLYWEHSLSLFNIYDYYEDYHKVGELLEKSQIALEGIRTKINLLILKRRIARNNLHLSSLKPAASSAVLASTAGLISEVFQEYQYYLLEHPLEKMKMEFLQAKTRLMQRPTAEALQPLIALTARLEEKLEAERDEGEYHAGESSFAELCIEVLAELGDASIQLGSSQDALIYYSRAFSRAREYFGDIYNRQCAELLQRIGRVHRSADRFRTYLQCSEMASKIYRTIYGRHHKAVVRQGRKEKDQLEETINQTMCNSARDEATYHS